MSGWIEEIRQGLFLSPAGVLILVDHAVPVRLGALVRALLADYPDLDVFTDVAELEGASDGATIVFLPKASDAEWLNLNRPMFARKALKVVLFSEREVTEALSRKAPDFYDWISHRQECPAGVAEHAVWGIRKALLARAPGILFLAHRDRRDRIEHVERVFQEALPGRRLLWLNPDEMPYPHIVAEIRKAGPTWVACDSKGPASAESFRWALAEARRRTRAILVLPEVFDDWFWSISDVLFGTTRGVDELLRKAGAKHPSRLAAVAGFEHALILSLVELLARGYREEALLQTMLRAPDPGAALAETILAAGIEARPLQGFHMSAPVQRHLGNLIGLRRPFQGPTTRMIGHWIFQFGTVGFTLMHGRADWIEYILRRENMTPERWLEIARLALDHGRFDAAATWAGRVFAIPTSKRSSEAYRLYGLALAEMSQIKRDIGNPDWIALGQFAEEALCVAEEALDPSTPPEDALALYAARIGILMNVGASAEAEKPLERALKLVDIPSARMRDIERVARVLRAKRKPERAEDLLKTALDKSTDPADRARIQMLLGWCAFDQGRTEEAFSIAEALLSAQNRSWLDANLNVRAGVDELRVQALLARGEPKKALAICDAELAGAADRWGKSSSRLLYWIPILARAMRRAGRARDAEVIFRKLLDLPLEFDADAVALGLSSRPAVLSFLHVPAHRILMDPRQRRIAQSELVQALRAQGRHQEADALEPQPKKNTPPSSH